MDLHPAVLTQQSGCFHSLFFLLRGRVFAFDRFTYLVTPARQLPYSVLVVTAFLW